jgi:hypothetical protein
VNADRVSFLEWLLSIISPGSSTTEGEEPEPEPIDPSKCASCSEYLAFVLCSGWLQVSIMP